MWNPDLCTKAYAFAARAHGEQKVMGCGFPYIYHVSLVAMEVMRALIIEKQDNEDLAVQCALLHDVLEDTDCTYAQIAAEFGAAVANGVLALSKVAALPEDQSMIDSLTRIKEQPREIWIVKLADRIVNLGPPPFEWNIEKRRQYNNEARLIHESLASASRYLSGRLMQKIKEYGDKLG